MIKMEEIQEQKKFEVHDNSYKAISPSLGLGDLPILDAQNRSLHDELIALQQQNIRDKSRNEHERDRVLELETSVANVSEALDQVLKSKISLDKALDSEKNLISLSSSLKNRLLKDSEEVRAEMQRVDEAIEHLIRDINGRKVVLELLEDEFTGEVDMLTKESLDIFDKEDDFIKLLKYQNEDEIRIKESRLQLEKMRERVEMERASLRKAAGDNSMKQVEMKRVTESFRSLHTERQEIRSKWKSVLDMVQLRDSEIQGIYKNIREKSEELRQSEILYNERLAFYHNEKRNVNEVQTEIRSLERINQRVEEELDKTENELDEIDCCIGLEKREIARVGLQIDKKRAQLKDYKTEYNRRIQRVQKIKGEISEIQKKKEASKTLATTAEDKTREADALLDLEERHYDSLLIQTDKMRLKKINKERELKDLEDEASALEITIKGLKNEKSKLLKSLKATKADVVKKEEINLKTSYDLATIENEVARMKGDKLSPEEKQEQKEKISSLKKDLESKKGEKNNLDRLLYKMEAEIKKMTRDILLIDEDVTSTKDKLEETELIISKVKVKNKSLQEQLENCILDEQMIKVAEAKARSEVESASNQLSELGKKGVEVENELRERRQELQARKDVLLAKERTKEEELSRINSQINERRDRASKLKIRYECQIKSLGDSQQLESEKIPSHAYHILKLAQEKASLEEEAAEISIEISKKEKELQELESTLSTLKNSNSSYKNQTSRHVDALPSAREEDIKSLEKCISQKKNEVANIQSQVRLLENELLLNRDKKKATDICLERSKRIYESKLSLLKNIEKEGSKQNEKYERALRLKCKVGKKCYEKNIANLGGLSYLDLEVEMDLRIERDKQRLSLIKARELCRVDDCFKRNLMKEIEHLGIVMPSVSRLEESSMGSRRGLSRRKSRNSSCIRTSCSHSDITLYRRSTSESRNPKVLLMKLDTNPVSRPIGVTAVR